MKKLLFIATLVSAGAFGATEPAAPPVAGGSSTVGFSISESTALAFGWSVKKGILGKSLYNESGVKIGKVEDLIVAPDKNVSFLIVGAGGFIGMGRHDVAIPVSQIKDQAGSLVMAGATKESIGALPNFAYSNDGAIREDFVAKADLDIAKAKDVIAGQERKAAAATDEAKVALDKQVSELRADMKSAEGKLAELKGAAANRWREFEAGVTAANARLRKAIDKAIA